MGEGLERSESGRKPRGLPNVTPAPKLNRCAESRTDLLVKEKKMLAVDITPAHQTSLKGGKVRR